MTYCARVQSNVACGKFRCIIVPRSIFVLLKSNQYSSVDKHRTQYVLDLLNENKLKIILLRSNKNTVCIRFPRRPNNLKLVVFKQKHNPSIVVRLLSFPYTLNLVFERIAGVKKQKPQTMYLLLTRL